VSCNWSSGCGVRDGEATCRWGGSVEAELEVSTEVGASEAVGVLTKAVAGTRWRDLMNSSMARDASSADCCDLSPATANCSFN
jgi:hypothetical protein